MAREDITEEMESKLRKKYYEEPEIPEGDVRDEHLDYLEDGLESMERQETMAAVQRLAASLVRKRNIAVKARASCGIEQIWREDELAFEGEDEASLRTRMIDYAVGSAPARRTQKEARRSRVVVNIIRPKCETAEGRFSDVLLPTDGKNWGLKETPVPELSDALDDETPVQLKTQPGVELKNEAGMPVTMGDVARNTKQVAEKKMSGMELVIDDQLNECNYNGESRKAIRNAIQCGTGILKGPVVVRDLKKRWSVQSDTDEMGNTVTVRKLELKEDQKPASKRVDYWSVYPDPECREDIKRAAHIWEREDILPRELRNLAKIEGYLVDEIEQVLLEEPTRTIVAENKDNQWDTKYNILERGNTYEKWEYNGDLDRDDLEALGCDCSDVQTQSVSACLIMVNDHVIKAMLNPLDTGELPYDFFQWTPRIGVPWGMGIARQMSWQQRVIIAAWRMMMDNAADSAGVNVVIGSGVEPADGIWELTGKKLWRNIDGVEVDIKKMFGQFQVVNNQNQFEAIIEMALRFLDLETSIPMIFQGEKGKAQSQIPKTLGATNIMVDSNNVSIRSRVKLWDDSVTRPHIGRYYDWNMQYNENEEIKGDFKVDARGTSVLLEKDQQGQSIEEVMAMRGDAELAAMVDWVKAVKQYFSARNLDIVLPEDKIAENMKKLSEKPPPQDPQLEVAKMRADGEIQKVQLQQQAESVKMQFESQQADIDRQHNERMKNMDIQLKMMELSGKTGIALDKIKSDLSRDAMKLRTQVSLATNKNVFPAEQVATPMVEPAGRASEGMAFQQ